MTTQLNRKYYVPWVDGYNADRIMAALKSELGPQGCKDLRRVRLSNQYGWRNQPQVVCFTTFHNAMGVKLFIQPTVDAAQPNALNIQVQGWGK